MKELHRTKRPRGLRAAARESSRAPLQRRLLRIRQMKVDEKGSDLICPGLGASRPARMVHENPTPSSQAAELSRVGSPSVYLTHI